MTFKTKKSPHSRLVSLNVGKSCIRNNHSKGRFLVLILPIMRSKSMWVEKLENGKYKFFERYKDPYTEKWRRVSVTLDSGSS
nr:MAG TPA: hypothetical protein [Caudoviricetes sp.]